MSYVISAFIVLLLIDFPIDLTSVNTCLLLLLYISLVQMFLNFGRYLSSLTVESLQKNIKIYEEIKAKGMLLENWSNVLRQYNEEMTVLQLKSLFVLLHDAYARKDKETFDQIIQRLKDMCVPAEKLKTEELFSKFIEDVDNKVYIAKFDHNLNKSIFVINDEKNEERNK